VGLCRVDTGIVVQKTPQGMRTCPILTVLFHPVFEEALRRANLSSRVSCQMSKNAVSSLNYNKRLMFSKKCRSTRKEREQIMKFLIMQVSLSSLIKHS
jgi:hypothetical protein